MKKFVYLSALFIAALLSSIMAWSWFRDNRMPNFDKRAIVFVRPGMSADEIIGTLSGQTRIRNVKALKAVFKAKEVDKYCKSGFYVVEKGCSSVRLARMLNNGWQSPVRLVIPETIRLKTQLAAKISSQLLIDSLSVIRALNDKELLAEYDVTPSTVMALFIPDTYEIYWTASMEDILQKQKDAYDAFWNEDRLSKCDELKMTKMQVSILASIVKGETNNKKEMPLIAGVYLNRMKLGMPLQACPTVAFCFDYKLHRVLHKHLKVDSPYNTYIHRGLPPGPISVPSAAAVDAVLNADFGTPTGKAGRGGYLYFCANSDFSGTHLFARTAAQHSANSRAYHKAIGLKKAG